MPVGSVNFSTIALFVVALTTAACNGAKTVHPPVREYGRTDKSVVGRFEALLADFDGWRVYELKNGDLVTCMAIKPAPGMPWPDLAGGPIWQARLPNAWSKEYRTLSGGAGFYMYSVNKTAIPFFGFYGKYPFQLPSLARQDGEAIYAVNDRDTVLNWEGKDIDFEVTTQPAEDRYETVDTAAGTLNFSGVTKAYQLIQACHERAS